MEAFNDGNMFSSSNEKKCCSACWNGFAAKTDFPACCLNSKCRGCHTAEKKCCERCLGKFPNEQTIKRNRLAGRPINCVIVDCPCHSEKPVQEKPSFTLQGVPVGSVWFNGVEYVPRVPATPVGEEWAGRIPYFEGGLIASTEQTGFVVKSQLKSFISKLLQAEREKGRTEWENINKQYKSREEAFREGAEMAYTKGDMDGRKAERQAERQRIEKAVQWLIKEWCMRGKVENGRELGFDYYIAALKAVLKVIRGSI